MKKFWIASANDYRTCCETFWRKAGLTCWRALVALGGTSTSLGRPLKSRTQWALTVTLGGEGGTSSADNRCFASQIAPRSRSL